MEKRTKADVAKAAGVPTATVDAMLSYIVAEVAAGNTVQFMGFGSFQPVEQAAREVTVPSTGKKTQAPAKYRPKFKAGASFKDAVATARKP
jgi:DNA-binding protein HU-beta